MNTNENQGTINIPNPAWRMWVCNFNAGYHDYGIPEVELYNRLGAEPPRVLEVTDPHNEYADYFSGDYMRG